jgi:hypothetical protein
MVALLDGTKSEHATRVSHRRIACRSGCRNWLRVAPVRSLSRSIGPSMARRLETQPTPAARSAAPDAAGLNRPGEAGDVPVPMPAEPSAYDPLPPAHGKQAYCVDGFDHHRPLHRIPPCSSLVELATGRGCASPWPSSPSPTAGLAPAHRPRPPPPTGRCRPRRSSCAAGAGRHHDPAALGQRLSGVLGLVAPHDHGEERCLLISPAADGHPEHGPGDAALGVADLGVVGQVAGEAHARLGHGVAPFWCLAGRSARPLEPGDGGCRGMPREHRGQAVEPTTSAMDQLPSGLGSGAGLVGEGLAAGGWACQHRPARSLHPGRGGRTRLPPRAARWPVPGCLLRFAEVG